MSPQRVSFVAGVRAELPILLGVVPFGLIYGATALAAGLSPFMAQAMSVIVFAGSAQFVIVQLVAGNVPLLVIAVTALVVNLRHLLYSASIAPYLRPLAKRHRRLLGYLLTDEAFTVSMIHFQQEPDEAAPGWYLAGAGLALWGTWQLSTAAGIFLGAGLPAWLPLDFALPLTFIAL
ncbi:MAG: AzlC family ABC transporter permease, partial [Anaerolineae bacterium]|nr:AzlC family ABC transporter permease [Anaerolineae bacterium]